MTRPTSTPFRSRRVKRALDSARVLDEVVANQLALVSRLPEDGRRRAADFLAELVMLAQAYRHYAAGWISRRELERRGSRSCNGSPRCAPGGRSSPSRTDLSPLGRIG